MSGLQNKQRGSGQFVNLKDGLFYVTDKETKEKTFYNSLTGTIVGVRFDEDEFEGDKYTKATFKIVNEKETYLLQMRDDSGYFRSMVNSLMHGTAKPLCEVELSPASEKKEDGRTRSRMYVWQGGKCLKFCYTKDNPGNMPPLEKQVIGKGAKAKTHWDSTEQIKFFSDWLNAVYPKLDKKDDYEKLPPLGQWQPINKEYETGDVPE